MRIEFADRLKGICICLVILGHSVIPDALLRFIYTFHMPAFFFVSGFFFSKKASLKKDSRRLLLPYVVCAAVVLCKDFIDAFRLDNFSMFLERLRISFFVGPDSSFGIDHNSVGPIWFLVALFWSRQLFSLVFKYRYGVIYAMLIGLASVLLGDCDGFPLGVIQGISGLFFMGVGFYYRALFYENSRDKKLWLVLPPLAAVSLFLPAIDMHYNIYPVYIVSCVCVSAMTLLICKLLVLTEHSKNMVCTYVSFLGRISILIFALHHIECSLFDWYAKLSMLPDLAVTAIRLVIVLGMAMLFYRVGIVRKLFQLK